MADNPRWLRVVLWAEGKVADPLDRISNSSHAAGLMLHVGDGRRIIRAATDRIRSGAVHALALPSKRDIDVLAAKVERLQRTLDDMAAEARDAETP